jgi:hypothetical protein
VDSPISSFASVYILVQSKHAAATSFLSKRNATLQPLLCISSGLSWWTAGLSVFTRTLLLPGFLLCIDGGWFVKRNRRQEINSFDET